MASDILRSSSAVWNGTLREGNGTLSTNSPTLKNAAYSFATRFEQAAGTNPEELIAAAHAACYSMALSATLTRKEYVVHHIKTEATVHLTPQQPSGFKITRIHLTTRAKIVDITPEIFKELAESTKQSCPVSQALAAVEITLDAALE